MKEILLSEDTHPANLWTAFTLINTFEELKKLIKKKNLFLIGDQYSENYLSVQQMNVMNVR